jgi:hypothetical protein
VHVQRAIAVLVTAIAIGIPLFNFAPKLYRWLLQDRMRKLYRRLRVVEKAMQKTLTAPQLAVAASRSGVHRRGIGNSSNATLGNVFWLQTRH